MDSQNKTAEIDSFLMSCRIIGKGIENVFLGQLLNLLFNLGYKKVRAKYIKSSKNLQTQLFYFNFGFELISKSSDVHEYEILLEKEFRIPSLYSFNCIDECIFNGEFYGEYNKKCHQSSLRN